jgi:exodeoxyribonuclease V alpha subunit
MCKSFFQSALDFSLAQGALRRDLRLSTSFSIPCEDTSSVISGVLTCSAFILTSRLLTTRALGIRELNVRLQNELNPGRADEPVVEKFGWQFRPRDKVIQTENDYDKEVFNGDIGQIVKIDPVEREVTIRFDQREVVYDFGELDEISLAYAITIHKSQGSEFPAVVIPLAMQQYMLLQRNLVYTGITRGKKLVVLIGQRKALGMAVRNNRTEDRFSGLLQ